MTYRWRVATSHVQVPPRQGWTREKSTYTKPDSQGYPGNAFARVSYLITLQTRPFNLLWLAELDFLWFNAHPQKRTTKWGLKPVFLVFAPCAHALQEIADYKCTHSKLDPPEFKNKGRCFSFERCLWQRHLSTLERVNVPGKSNLAQHQSKDLDLLYFLCSKGPSVWLPTGNGKSRNHQLCAAFVKELSSTGLKSVPRRLVCCNCLSA